MNDIALEFLFAMLVVVGVSAISVALGVGS